MILLPLLVTASFGIFVADAPVRITEAELEAAEYGRVLGAAAQCRSIDQDRVKSAVHHASLVVRALTGNAQEFENARGSFEQAALTGGADIAAGRETCADAEAGLKRIETKFTGK